MSTSAEPIIAFPPAWPDVVRMLQMLDASDAVSPEQWDVIVKWLVSTGFDECSILAGEAAALLIRDRAPASVRSQFRESSSTGDDWLWHLLTISFEREQDEQYPELIERAAQSHLPHVRMSARSRLSH